MFTKQTPLKALFMLIFAFTTLQTSAQPPVFDDDIEDETDVPAAPVDGYIAIAFASALALGWFSLSAKKTQSNN